MRALILDNEAVQSLADVAHAEHRRVVAHLHGAVDRRRRGRSTDAVVPTAVRVEAGWDRSRPGAAALNRFRVHDRELDEASANVAAGIISSGVVTSVADAHIGATARGLAADDIVVLTSDPKDISAVCAPRSVRVVTI
ncbi:MAG: hypothetical protein WD225_08215 [Ilumatobacteraceae bacterium]